MKKIILITAIVICIFSLVSCGSDEDIVILGSYFMDTKSQEDFIIPNITFNEEDNSFVFKMDVLSSYIGIGNFTIDDSKIKAVTNDDNPNTYIFEIIDSDTLSFKVNESSKLQIIDTNISNLIENTVVFKKTK